MQQPLANNLSRLNARQLEAVETLQGPVLVVAGPGTGKTQVIANRIAKILQLPDTSASDILCLTFTESGVNAMRKRLISIIGTEAYYVHINTFHGFCNDIIRSFPEKFAFREELLELDDLNRIKVIREIIDELAQTNEISLIPFGDKYRNQNSIITAIQNLKREGVISDRFKKIAANELEKLESNVDLNPKTNRPKAKWVSALNYAKRNKELAIMYEKYKEKLSTLGFYDYEDMILYVIDKFKSDDELLAIYQEKFLYILVDEYQDTNGAQNEILKLLGSFDKSPNIFAVGDDDQAIYRFQGASVENMLFFEKQFENVKTIVIDESYRSSQLILDASDSFIKNNAGRLVNTQKGLVKKLKSAKSEIPNNKIQVYDFANDEGERRFIIDKVKLLKTKGINYSDIAILYRRNVDGEAIAEEMLKEDIPLKLVAGRSALDERRVKQLISLFKVILYEDFDRDFLLSSVLFYDFLDLNQVDVFRIVRYFSDKTRLESGSRKDVYLKFTLLDLLIDGKALDFLDLKEKKKIAEFSKKLVHWKKLSNNTPISQLFITVASESGFTDFVYSQKEINIEEINSVSSFFEYVRNINKKNGLTTLRDFLKDLTLLEENGLNVAERELDFEKEGVNLMTAHKAKGLEFGHVFIINFYDKHWSGGGMRDVIKLPGSIYDLTNEGKVGVAPEGEVGQSNLSQEDDRRLVFVALTRAKEQLYITYAKQYPSGNTYKETSPSQFIFEIENKYLDFVDTSKYNEFNFDATKRSLSVKHLEKPSDEESDFLKECLVNFKLSPSALEEYIKCPRKFKFNRLLRVPSVPSRNISMGIAIHYALEKYARTKMKGQSPDLDQILGFYAKRLSMEVLDAEDLEQTLVEGKNLLSKYFTFYDLTEEEIVGAEYNFTRNNVYLTGQGYEPIPITGKVDKLVLLDPKSHDSGVKHIKIVDYKASRPESANQIKGQTKNSEGKIFRQLVFYKLLTDLDSNFRPTKVSPKYSVDLVEVDFLKQDQKGNLIKRSFEINDEDVALLKTKIIDVMGRIRNLEFEGSGEYPVCSECEFCRNINK